MLITPVELNQLWNSDNANLTLGSFADETESHEAFYSLAVETRCFRCFHEVPAHHICELPHWRDRKDGMRADFILLPTERLVSAGFPENHAIVVECKRSGISIGPAVNQLMDYVRCSFIVDGKEVFPTWGFVWPANKQNRAIASVMAHQHVGTVHTQKLLAKYPDPRQEAFFHLGESRLFRITPDSVDVLKSTLAIGRKTGSR